MKNGDVLPFTPPLPELPATPESAAQSEVSRAEQLVVPFGSIMSVEIPDAYIHSPPASAKINTALPEPDSQENDGQKK